MLSVPSRVGVKFEQRIMWGGPFYFARGVPSPVVECRDSHAPLHTPVRREFHPSETLSEELTSLLPTTRKKAGCKHAAGESKQAVKQRLAPQRPPFVQTSFSFRAALQLPERQPSGSSLNPHCFPLLSSCFSMALIIGCGVFSVWLIWAASIRPRNASKSHAADERSHVVSLVAIASGTGRTATAYRFARCQQFDIHPATRDTANR